MNSHQTVINQLKFVLMCTHIAAGTEAMVASTKRADALGFASGAGGIAKMLHATNEAMTVPKGDERVAVMKKHREELKGLLAKLSEDQRAEAFILLETLEATCFAAKNATLDVMVEKGDKCAPDIIIDQGRTMLERAVTQAIGGAQDAPKPKPAPAMDAEEVGRAIDELLKGRL